MSLSAVLKRAGHECVIFDQANPETRRQPEQFQRDFDEVFDQCLQASWRSAMRPRALPVE